MVLLLVYMLDGQKQLRLIRSGPRGRPSHFHHRLIATMAAVFALPSAVASSVHSMGRRGRDRFDRHIPAGGGAKRGSRLGASDADGCHPAQPPVHAGDPLHELFTTPAG